MSTSNKVILTIAIMMFLLAPLGAWAVYTPPDADFCTQFSRLITNPVVGYLPSDFQGLLALFKPPLADINGTSLIDTKPSLHPDLYPRDQYPQAYKEDPVGSGNWVLLDTVIDIHGNGMRDCGAELGILYKALTDTTVNLPNGLTHQMAVDAWSHNWDTLGTCIGNYWTLVGSLAPELRFILVGYLCMGDGSFTADPPIAPETKSTVFHLTGGGGFIAGLLTIMQNSGLLANPSLMDLSNYTLLPQFLSAAGDADHDNCSNLNEYQKAGTVSLPSPIPNPLPASWVTAVATADTNYITYALNPVLDCHYGPTGGLPDADHDGLPDEMEAIYGTNPNNPDTDGGGVFDGVEVSLGMDPLDPSDDHLVPVTGQFGLALLGAMMCIAARRRMKTAR